MIDQPHTKINVRQRISTLLFAVLIGVSGLFGLGLILVTIRLFEVRSELDALRNRSLPVLIRLSQLSQDSSASSSIAPALSQAQTRSEFETLVARIHDKQASQELLIDELEDLNADPERITALRSSVAMLTVNLDRLANVVADQIDVHRQLEAHVHGIERYLTDLQNQEPGVAPSTLELAARAVSQIKLLLNEPERAKFSRNRQSADASVEVFAHHINDLNTGGIGETAVGRAADLVTSWPETRQGILETKTSQLSNAFEIKALVEESSLIANRLLSSAGNEFWRANKELEDQIQLVAKTTRFTLLAILGVALILVAGSLFFCVDSETPGFPAPRKHQRSS